MGKRSLAEASKGRLPARPGYETWDVLLRRRNPERMDEIEAWCDEWESGGGREFYKTRNAFAQFVIEQSDGAVRNAPAVVTYMKRRAHAKSRRSK